VYIGPVHAMLSYLIRKLFVTFQFDNLSTSNHL
jgi:hypothetical protein